MSVGAAATIIQRVYRGFRARLIAAAVRQELSARWRGAITPMWEAVNSDIEVFSVLLLKKLFSYRPDIVPLFPNASDDRNRCMVCFADPAY